jgi:hypothetical protein
MTAMYLESIELLMSQLRHCRAVLRKHRWCSANLRSLLFEDRLQRQVGLKDYAVVLPSLDVRCRSPHRFVVCLDLLLHLLHLLLHLLHLLLHLLHLLLHLLLPL